MAGWTWLAGYGRLAVATLPGLELHSLKTMKTLDTFGNCRTPVFLLGLSQCIKKTNFRPCENFERE